MQADLINVDVNINYAVCYFGKLSCLLLTFWSMESTRHHLISHLQD